jgi:hypothetical protein
MPIGTTYGTRRYNERIALTYAEAVVDEYGHASFDNPQVVLEVYASVQQMSATKSLMTFQQADAIGLDVEFRNPNVRFNGIRYRGHDVVFSQPQELERGRILRISGFYQQDNPQII